MAKSYRQILREVGDACDYVRFGDTVRDAVADGTTSGSRLAHLSDGDLVEDYLPEMLKLEPSEIGRYS